MQMRDTSETSDKAPVSPAIPEIADPGPLGLGAFAMTTFVLSVFNAGLVTLGVSVVLGLALAYGGLAQLLAGMWEFRKGNTFGAVAFSSYGAFWISFWVLLNTTPVVPAKAVGVYLLAWLIFTTYMIVPALRTNLGILAVFVALALTYLFLCIGALGGSDGMTKVGGWLGLITAVLAWYTAFAAVTNATWKRTVLPVWPLSR
jgi:succinate-acetate transporter protein